MLSLVIACSGPGAMRSIARNIESGNGYALMHLGLLLLAVGWWLLTGKDRWLAAALLVTLLLHPAWTVSAASGDCGTFKLQASLGLLQLGAAALGLQVLVRGLYYLLPDKRQVTPN